MGKIQDLAPLTKKAVFYTWNQLLERAAVRPLRQSQGCSIEGLDLLYEHPEDVQDRDRCIVVAPCRNEAWYELLNRNKGSLRRIPIHELVPKGSHVPLQDPVPAIFWGRGHETARTPFVERQRRARVVFYADIVAATFFMLSRWEEFIVSERDRHGRFKARSSVAFKQDFLDRPIVDEYALVLKTWIAALAPWNVTTGRRFSVQLSHDVDHVRSSIRSIGGDLLRRPSLGKVARGLQHICWAKSDPHLQGCYQLADISERYGFKSAFYIKGSSPGPMDSGYDPSGRLIQRCLRDLASRGHELGFHAGYRTSDNLETFLAEKSRVEAALKIAPRGGRQHYLRFDVSSTWKLWEKGGFAYDSTVGYAQHEGFRCGTCHPYVPFIMADDRQCELREVPLIVMDGTLKSYRQLTPEIGERAIIRLARRCKSVGGVFTMLWHNSSTVRGWEAWFEMYRRVVCQLSRMVQSV